MEKMSLIERIKNSFGKLFNREKSVSSNIINIDNKKHRNDIADSFNDAFEEYLKSQQSRSGRRGVIRDAQIEAQRIIDDAKAEANRILNESSLLKAVQTEAEKIKQEVIAECEEIKRKTFDECEEMKLKASKNVACNQKKSKPFFSFFKKVLKNELPKQKETPDTEIIPVLRINITNYYNCISYQQIKRATDGIFKEDNIFSNVYHCPNEKEIRAVTGNSDPTITREATSAYFANYVLEGLDNNFNKHCCSAGINYFRRHDDIFLIGDRESCKKVANYICKQLQIYNFTFENDKNYLSFNDRVKVEEILKSEPYNIIRFYINYIRNVDTFFYKDMQKYVCI